MKLLASFLSNYPEDFLNSHSTLTLCHIFFSYLRCAQSTNNQKIGLKIIPIHISTYGILLAIPLASPECVAFEKKIILKEAQNLIPGLKDLPNSYLCFSDKVLRIFYIEIRKTRGGCLNSEERKLFYSELLSRLQEIATNTSKPLLFPGTEEEQFKNIRHLSQELKYVRDLPQVMISFVEYLPNRLKFLVVVLRIIKPDSATLISLSNHLSSSVKFSLENVLCLDKVRKKYLKEATVFTLEVSGSLFVHNHQMVNLRMARQYIVKEVESMIGPFRDYNGGLISKEQEQLISIKRNLEKKGLFFPFLEDFFYSIKPISFRILISDDIAIELILLFQKISKEPLSHKRYCFEIFRSPNEHLAIIKTKEADLKDSIGQQILSYSSAIGFATIEWEGLLYLCFFYRNPTSDFLFDTIHKILDLIFIDKQQRAILRFNFQAGEPPSLNPRLAHDIRCQILANLLFEGLTQVNQHGIIEPAAAEKIEISSSGLHYTFHLRKAFWSNGEQVTAHHSPQLSPLPPKYSQINGNIDGNVKKANFFFNKALVELGLCKENFPPILINHSDLSFEKPLMLELQRQWMETLGITIIFKPLPWNEFSADLENRNFQLAGLFRRDFYSHPMFYLNFLKNTPHNPYAWNNNEYNTLLDETFYSGNTKKNLKKIENFLINKAPIISLVSQKYQILVNKKVKGIQWNDNGCLDLKSVRIDE